MKALIVEDDFASRKLLFSILAKFGECDMASNGKEALEAFYAAHSQSVPYDLICLDFMMPEFNGIEILKKIREIEGSINIEGLSKVKIIMATGMSDNKTILDSFREGVEAYLIKPLDRKKLIGELLKLRLINDSEIESL